MDKSQFEKFSKQGYNNIPIYKQLTINKETALSLYLKLANNPYSYLFESMQDGKKWGRYSIIGLQSDTIIKVFDCDIYLQKKDNQKKITVENPLDWIDDYQKQFKTPTLDIFGNFSGGLVGYFGYETIRYIEPKLKNINNLDELNTPDILLMLSNNLIVFDNLNNLAFIITYVDPQQQTFTSALKKIDYIEKKIKTNVVKEKLINKKVNKNEFISTYGKENYKNSVNKIKKYIINGDCMQVVPSQRLKCDFDIPAIELYRKLRIINPSPYMYYLNLEDFTIVGSSPEILVKVDNHKIAKVRPLAGTRKRGKTKIDDEKIAKELLNDDKEVAEHLMLIDLGRNDLGRIAKTGKVKVTAKMKIEKYSHVMHISSSVECEIKDNLSNIDVLRATFPAGTLSGAPKIRAMEIINEVEPIKRNIYSGAIGYLAFNGAMDMAIAIRTAVIKDKKLYIQAGAGVVFDSIAELEWEETMHKASALINSANAL